MSAIEASTKCPCGETLHISIYKPQSFAQKSESITCKACSSKFMATAKRKASKGEIVFEIIDLSEKACDALKVKAGEATISVTHNDKEIGVVTVSENTVSLDCHSPMEFGSEERERALLTFAANAVELIKSKSGESNGSPVS